MSDLIGNALRADAVAYWTMNEASGTRLDATGHGNDLVPTSIPDVIDGRVGNAVDFSISSPNWPSYLSINSNSYLETGAVNYTFLLWAKIHAKDQDYPFISKVGPGAFEYQVVYEKSTDRLAFFLKSSDIWADNYGSPPVNEWIMIEASYEISGTLTSIRVDNNTLDFTDDPTPQVSYPNAPFRIGADIIANVYADAAVDEVGLWKRPLTQAERDYLYNDGVGRALFGELFIGVNADSAEYRTKGVRIYP